MRRVQIRRGAYVDSVALMQVSKQVGALEGVTAALVAMATDLNVELATQMGFQVSETGANHMLIAVEADTDEAHEAALAEVDAALNESSLPSSPGSDLEPAPALLGAAARRLPRDQTAVALVSTPGDHAFVDAIDALDAGLHTMLFSDNVSIEQEVSLKEYADPSGLLVMGPDCGTAVIGGVGLGFANVVRPGPVGIVAASGTGAQQLMCLLDACGVGISHCLGVGGRDLSEPVAGRSTRRALELLAQDEATELIVVVSKPPAPGVARAIRGHAASVADSHGVPVMFALLGPGEPDLTASARQVVEATGATWAEPRHWQSRRAPSAARRAGGSLRGLFTGGTLRDEARLIATERLGPIGTDLADTAHTMVDLGDDEFTRGRPHPMVDASSRTDLLLAQIDEPRTSVLLLDVVLGLAADPDPAASLVGPVGTATEQGVPVVVSLVGSRDDPQGLERQAAALADAGARVHLSNAEATRKAVDLVEGAS
ncbi:MAG TPA: FdrA family protein [Nocardioidaceae bacterium]|nr:FdrA family protein [Nocardioidaceae bacterium]